LRVIQITCHDLSLFFALGSNFISDKLIADRCRQEQIMAHLTWADEYSVGVKSIDGQHMKLFELYNKLYEAMLIGHTQDFTGKLLNELVKYTHEHFQTEETMMAAAKYSGLDGHRAKHHELTHQVEEFLLKFQKGESMINLKLLHFLRDWLITHIQHEDKEYGPSLQKSGVH
jgi:hemerythrin-like metal-binding protein